jgi:DNA-binding NtrC family response regulator
MPKELRLLMVEDSEDDQVLLLHELKKAGYEPVSRRIETAREMQAALAGEEWDVIISDFVMPRFSGLAALEVLRQSGLDIPFIIVSGNIGEDIAVGAMKAGAHDYILKSSLLRLVPAIEREMRDAVVRRQRRKAREDLKRAYEELEQKVDERTRELQIANEALQEEIEVRKLLEHEREEYVKELQMALAEVKTLSGLLPICASCKKIRDDNGYWNQIEKYLRTHTQARFTHGICPDCARKLYPEYLKDSD